jgi:hypothetical protein
VLLNPRPVQPSTVLARSRTLRAGSAGAAVATSLTAAARGALPEGKVGTMGWSLSIEQRDVAFALSSASPSMTNLLNLTHTTEIWWSRARTRAFRVQKFLSL